MEARISLYLSCIDLKSGRLVEYIGIRDIIKKMHYIIKNEFQVCGVIMFNFRLPDLGEKAYVVFSCLSRSE